jgi:hypothetical protein
LIIGTAVSAFGSAVVAVALIGIFEKWDSCVGKETPFMNPAASWGKEEAPLRAAENEKNAEGDTSRLAPWELHS